MVMPLLGIFLETLSLQNLYFQWESAGIFEFFLPALLIFAVIFGVLTATNILGGNKGIHAIIAIAIAILAVRTPLVTSFFTDLFPSFAVGLAIILGVMILGGLFVTKGNMKPFYNTMMWSGLGIAVIAAIIVFDNHNWYGSFWWQENWTSVLWVVILVLIVLGIINTSKSEKNDDAKWVTPFGKLRSDEH